jgi:hypothetical protein
MLGNILPNFSGGGISTGFSMQAQVTMKAI